MYIDLVNGFFTLVLPCAYHVTMRHTLRSEEGTMTTAKIMTSSKHMKLTQHTSFPYLLYQNYLMYFSHPSVKNYMKIELTKERRHTVTLYVASYFIIFI